MEYVSIKNLGRTEYSEAWEIQKRLFGQLLQQKQQGSAEEQYLLLVEHPHVYTLGKKRPRVEPARQRAVSG